MYFVEFKPNGDVKINTNERKNYPSDFESFELSAERKLCFHLFNLIACSQSFFVERIKILSRIPITDYLYSVKWNGEALVDADGDNFHHRKPKYFGKRVTEAIMYDGVLYVIKEADYEV